MPVISLIWLAVTVLLLILEAAIPGLVCLWFAGGALVGAIVGWCGASLLTQIIVFLVVSLVLLLLLRPWAARMVNDRHVPTNADSVLGRECIVTETIDSVAGTGQVRVDGRLWSARAEGAQHSYDVGTRLIARRIEGVRLIVGPATEARRNDP